MTHQPDTARPAVLTDAERTMLAYALDLAQDQIWSEDGFTDEDQAAVDALRRLAAETPQPEATPVAASAARANESTSPVDRSAVLAEMEQRVRQYARDAVHPDYRAAYTAIANDLRGMAAVARPDDTTGA